MHLDCDHSQDFYVHDVNNENEAVSLQHHLLLGTSSLFHWTYINTTVPPPPHHSTPPLSGLELLDLGSIASMHFDCDRSQGFLFMTSIMRMSRIITTLFIFRNMCIISLSLLFLLKKNSASYYRLHLFSHCAACCVVIMPAQFWTCWWRELCWHKKPLVMFPCYGVAREGKLNTILISWV